MVDQYVEQLDVTAFTITVMASAVVVSVTIRSDRKVSSHSSFSISKIRAKVKGLNSIKDRFRVRLHFSSTDRSVLNVQQALQNAANKKCYCLKFHHFQYVRKYWKGIVAEQNPNGLTTWKNLFHPWSQMLN